MRQFQSSFVISKTTLRWLHLLEHMEHASHTPILFDFWTYKKLN
ncbi:hypothetical protein A5885_003354 [Enterococcus sp. 8E11_MSG4843]|nr:hypothetical protein A5885_003354 [Enterococcus sp. 8E11_MSG4843]